MKVFIGYSTSLLYWLNVGAQRMENYRCAWVNTLDDAAKTKQSLNAINLKSYGFTATIPKGWSGQTSQPTTASQNMTPGIHVLVPENCRRTRLDGFYRHRWSTDIPKNAFRAIAPGVLVSTPEFSFLQLAGVLSLPQLTLVGYWLCAAYRINKSGKLEEVAPLTSTERIRSFLESTDGCYGIKRARRALRFIADGARSPMEVNTAMLTSLPKSHGGYGFAVPTLNYVIRAEDLDQRTIDRPDRFEFKVDLYWEKKHAGLEYEGDDHLNKEKARADKRRLNCLTANGEKILTLMYDQIANPQTRAILMNQLGKLLGKTVSPPTMAQEHARVALDELLFGNSFSL